MSNLYSYGTSDLTLTEAIEKYSEYLGEAIALLYSPKSSAFAKLAQGKSLTDAQGNIIKNINIYNNVNQLYYKVTATYLKKRLSHNIIIFILILKLILTL